jgi:hypothetical protein
MVIGDLQICLVHDSWVGEDKDLAHSYVLENSNDTVFLASNRVCILFSLILLDPRE